ncbi:GAF domain-containing sensor histidine kinase [Bacillus sp. DTU_2020_1000418_1_SI_GHA_SEK_038]|uniref:GAF domain-containing sensor histidine kinase n=1 Tax=Bacillus sp. DTU_2020_1000418_1_SI_GHA_SEK_038 TaxID=3077585 RepID=UPI0028F113AA|nr:GAF domain-containing sensor histidine kinase [Bacillus sp. DTU_2020_1000418_1_SI_GHA_SEK_038]WNS76708.1 GAF domain-containing sensor histidine kinase [Bacillus sp. DTU_2020_1000418_1_SI_GHA_SEK_038]
MTLENRYSEIWILKEIAELLNEGTEIKKILSEVLAKLLHVTGLETGWVFLFEPDGKYELAAKEKLPAALSYNHNERMCKGECWCIDRYIDGRLHKAINIIECKRIEDARNEKIADTNQLTHHATVPLRAGDEKFGILNVGSPNKTHFSKEELALLESIAFQIGTALKRIKLTGQEQENALTAERNRLARDLHDSVNQLLFSLSLTARGGAEMTMEPDTKETFSYIQDLAQEALIEMRALIWQLRPRGLENGIISALLSYGEMLDLEVSSKVKGVVSLPGKVEEALWRIGQEALANCKKHSGQPKVELILSVEQKRANMVISDYGCGFYYDGDLRNIPSLGLKSMRDRTESLNGEFKLTSSEENGTRIEVSIPI